MKTVTKGLALVATVVLLTGCIVIPVERHTTETHHHYHGEAAPSGDVAATPASCPVVEED